MRLLHGLKGCVVSARNFIHNKEKPVRRFEEIKNYVFGLVPQGQTELFTNSLKDLCYICGIKSQKNGRDVKY